jgi:hypothetical protein
MAEIATALADLGGTANKPVFLVFSAGVTSGVNFT